MVEEVADKTKYKNAADFLFYRELGINADEMNKE